MAAVMLSPIAARSECLVAKFALEGSVTCVHSLVHLEVGFVFEFLPTHLTHSYRQKKRISVQILI